jgi:hypothetical protein
MCFGQEQVDSKTTTPSPQATAAANANLDFTQKLRDTGFQGYKGQQVAGFAPQQQSSFDMTNNVAGNNTASRADQLIGTYSGAPAQNVQADTIANNMSPYMNQYVMRALAPQLEQMNIQDAKTRAATNATATGSGAFGDARTGIEQANNSFLSNVAREGLIGNAYNQAFNTAIGAGAQDVGNKLAASNANAGYGETALNRSLGGATALQGLQNQQLGVAGAQNQMGQQQTAKSQAELTAQYNQWLMAQQYPFQTAGLVNQTVAAATPASPTTTTESKPNNSGLAIGGALLSAFI